MTHTHATSAALLLAAAAALAGPDAAAAQSVEPCDGRAQAGAIVEPWEANSRSYANGAIRLAILDAIEPAAAAYWLLVLSPPTGPLGERQCRLVGLEPGLGFGALSFEGASARYDPARGLTVSLPGMIYLPERGFANPVILSVTINQASGEVTATTRLGPE